MPRNSTHTAAASSGLAQSRFGTLTDCRSKLLQRLAGDRGTATRDVLRHVVILATGSGTAKCVGVLSIPIITRLYTPEHFGLFALFLSCIALLTPLASLRYSAALPLPRRDRTAVALLLACLLLLSLFIALLALLFAVSSDRLFALVSAQALAPFWPLLLASIGTAGLHEILTSWSVREKSFRIIAKADVSQSILGAALKITLALAALQHIGLYIGHIAAQATACALLARRAWRDASAFARRASARHVRLVAARYSAFPGYRLPSQVLMTFGQQAPLLFVSAIYGAATAGQLGLALVALALPLTLIGQNAGQAYYAEIARIGCGDPVRICRVTCEVTVRLLAMAIVPTLVLMIAGTELFVLFFGARWHDAGMFASVLSIYLPAQFVANLLSHALSVFDKQHVYLRLNVVRVVMIVGIFGIAYQLKLSAFMTIAAYSVVLSVHYVATSVSIFMIIRRAISGQGNVPDLAGPQSGVAR